MTHCASQPLVVCINASPRKLEEGGQTARLLNRIMKGVREEQGRAIEVRLYEHTNIVFEQGLYSRDPTLATIANMPADDITKLYPLLREANAFVFATPVYWGNISAILQTFIEHLTPLENEGFAFEGKPTAILAVSGGEGGGERTAINLMYPLYQMGFYVIPWGMLYYPAAYATAEGKVIQWAEEDAPQVGRNLVRAARRETLHSISWYDE